MADIKQKARECAKEISDAIVDAESVGDILGAPKFAFFIEQCLIQCIAEEREECASIADHEAEADGWHYMQYCEAAKNIAKTIRARKES